MRNDDVKKITEIKQYLLDPPVSFKLYEYAPAYIRDAVNVLNNYPQTKELADYLHDLASQFDSKTISQEDVRKTLKEAGIKISKLPVNNALRKNKF